MSPEQIKMLIGVLLLILSASFAYKAFMSIVHGKVWIWTGFLPFTLVSPWLVHLPPKPNSLTKEVQAMWVHMLIGPLMFVTMLLTLVAGSDLVGWPGSELANKLFTANNPDKTPAIQFDKDHYRYSFPAMARAGKKLEKMVFHTKVFEEEKDKLLQGGPTGSYAQASQSASGN